MSKLSSYMNRRTFLRKASQGAVFVSGALTFPKWVFGSPNKSSNLEEYCFLISPHKSIAMRDINSTPEQFLKDNPSVQAAINGPQFRDNHTMGLSYLKKNYYYSNEDPGDIRAYFSISNDGRRVAVTNDLEGHVIGYWSKNKRFILKDYWMVIGARPALLLNGNISKEALHPGYIGTSYRSAIGTKTGKDICFAVSTDAILMSEWAERLKDAGYEGALNLDGGPISQMAVRNKSDNISVKGKGTGNTKLVIFEYNR